MPVYFLLPAATAPRHADYYYAAAAFSQDMIDYRRCFDIFIYAYVITPRLFRYCHTIFCR